MAFLRPLFMVVALFLVSCADNNQSNKETQACIQYRTMMTAPMPEAAVDELKRQCEHSRR